MSKKRKHNNDKIEKSAIKKLQNLEFNNLLEFYRLYRTIYCTSITILFKLFICY